MLRLGTHLAILPHNGMIQDKNFYLPFALSVGRNFILQNKVLKMSFLLVNCLGEWP